MKGDQSISILEKEDTPIYIYMSIQVEALLKEKTIKLKRIRDKTKQRNCFIVETITN